MARAAERAAYSAQYAAYQVGGFTLDIDRKALLTAEGAEVPLRPKSFSMLLLLVENAGRILSNDTIMSSVWPGLFVTENNITQCVHEIRNALGAKAQQILRTRPRHGYLVAADVVAVPIAEDCEIGVAAAHRRIAAPAHASRTGAAPSDGAVNNGIVQLKAKPPPFHDRGAEHDTGMAESHEALLKVVANRELQSTDLAVDEPARRVWEATEGDPLRHAVSGFGARRSNGLGVESKDIGAMTVVSADPEQLRPSGAPRLSLVVLPFVNLGGDPKEEYFVDGVTECLTTDLSRIRGAFVIARNTAFTYKGKLRDAKGIGRELNVRYVLDGSVQRAGKRMRVSVQLIDAENGHHLWAERFDKPVADFLELQDEISARLANQLGAALIAAEARRSERTPNPDAFDLYLQGMAWINMGPYPAHLSQARALFDRALSIEPDNVDALVGSGCADFWEVADWTSSERVQRILAAEASLSKALSSAPDNAPAHLLLSAVKTYSNRPVQGIAEAERALALDSNLAAALATIGLAKLFVGRPEETEGYVRQALRRSPRDRLTFIWFAVVGASKLHLGVYDDAATWLTQSAAINPNFASTRFLLAAAFGQLDRTAEAFAEAQTALALNPGFTISLFRAYPECDNAVFREQRHNIYDGLRKAGVPEQ